MIVLVLVAAVGLPRIRAAVSSAPQGAAMETDPPPLTDESAIAEAHFMWGNPIESLLIWDTAVVARSSCAQPFYANPVQGTITQSRTVEAYGPFGFTFSRVEVDCRGETERS